MLHIPAKSPSRLDRVLSGKSSMPVVIAQDGQEIRSGCIYVASADRHLMIQDGFIRVTRGPKECRVRPAIDVLFRSAAIDRGPQVVGVMLSGMLDDGTAGCWAIKDHGGLVMVQDPA